MNKNKLAIFFTAFTLDPIEKKFTLKGKKYPPLKNPSSINIVEEYFKVHGIEPTYKALTGQTITNINKSKKIADKDKVFYQKFYDQLTCMGKNLDSSLFWDFQYTLADLNADLKIRIKTQARLHKRYNSIVQITPNYDSDKPYATLNQYIQRLNDLVSLLSHYKVFDESTLQTKVPEFNRFILGENLAEEVREFFLTYGQ